MGGDIAKQMPVEAKKFAKIDKDWAKNMLKGAGVHPHRYCCINCALTLDYKNSNIKKGYAPPGGREDTRKTRW